MVNYGFHFWWGVSFVVLLVLAFLVGKVGSCSKKILGILIDVRLRYSLTHLQIVLWTIVILSSLLGVWISADFSWDAIVISPQLLGLMGISAGSGVLATGVKGIKDASHVKIARGVLHLHHDKGTPTIEDASLAQIWLEEEGEQANKVVNITKFQNFIFTLVILGVYVTMAWKGGKLPILPDNVVWLIGISHAGYVGGKVPDKK